MKKTQIKLLAVVASSLVAFSASAAEPCKAYVKLDLGYGISSGTRLHGEGFVAGTPITKTAIDSQLDKGQRGMIGAAAIGYAFNDAMRGEVSFDFRPKMKAHANSFTLETRELGGSAKVLYDFNNTTPVTPFLFASVGASNIKPKVKPYAAPSMGWNQTNSHLALAQINEDGSYVKDAAGNIPMHQSLDMKSKTVMTYSGGFGLSFKGSDAVNLDLTYGIGGKTNYIVASNIASVNTSALASPSAPSAAASEGSIKNSDLMQQVKFKKQMDQSVTLGVRFTM